MREREALDPERWNRASELFEQLADAPGAEREAILAQLRRDDAALHALVVRLLQSDAGEASFLNVGVAAAAHLIDTDHDLVSTASNKASIGPYQILAEIGRGGMGIVLLAERQEGDFQQRVAIKCLTSLRPSDREIRRFLRERRILARLSHPNIARLYDGGVMEHGEPYLVMEYVPGERIDRYCDEHTLDIDRRLALFITICEAVQYAHQQLVVHRDLKPGNILVTSDGHVKLLDFGIASYLDHPDDASGETATTRAFTPEYASPEQLRGEPLTPATDIFSLGLILFELLTGCRPFASAGAIRQLQAVLVDDPAKASATVDVRDSRDVRTATDARSRALQRASTPALLQRRLRGDLDTILERALAKEPAARYQSAQALLEDIRRHLEGRPVLAHRPSRRYRIRKFVRRNRSVVVASVLGIVALVGGLASAVWQARLVTRQRDVARAEAVKARRVTDFLVSVFREAEPATARGRELTAREILDRGVERIGKELRDEPALRATVERMIGTVYLRLAEYPTAKALLERSYETHRAVLAADDPELADDVHALALYATDRSNNADSLFRSALDARRRTLAAGDPRIADELAGLGASLLTSDTAAADGLLHEALDIYNAAPGHDAERVGVLNSIGLLRHHQGHYEIAENYYRESLTIGREWYGSDHPQVLQVASNLGWLRQLRGDYPTADSILRDVLAVRRRVFGDLHPTVAATLAGLAEVSFNQADYRQAETQLHESMTIHERHFGPADPRTIDNLVRIADMRAARGRWREAQTAYVEGESRLARAGLARTLRMARLINNRASVYERAHDFRGATLQYRRAWRLYADLSGPRHAFTGIVQGNIGTSLLLQDSLRAAETELRSALSILREAYSADHPSLSAVLIDLGTIDLRAGRRQACESTLREAIAIAEAKLPASHWRTAQGKVRLGRCLTAASKYAEAEPLLNAALNTLETLRVSRRDDHREALIGLSELYERTQRPELALQARARLKEP